MQEKERYLSIIKEIFSRNRFVELCDIVIDDITCGSATLHMPIDGEKHVNPQGYVHGGAFSTLANTAIGVACCAVGAQTVTQTITTNFISNITSGHTAICTATVTHRGKRTITLTAEVRNDEGTLMCQTLCIMFVTGAMENIPEKW